MNDLHDRPDEQRTPLVLLHGVTNNATVWDPVLPHLGPDFDVLVPTALGHQGGKAVPTADRPVTLAAIVDDLECQMDAAGMPVAHLAGNSMGGWAALELARRGRALSVCAFSPAGTWGEEGRPETNNRLRGALRLARLTRPIAPLVLSTGTARRWAMRLNARHGDRIPKSRMLAIIDTSLACAVTEDMLSTNEHLGGVDPLPCPVTILWARHDRVLPLDTNGRRARELVPGATFIVLDDVGHVPMFDDPLLVANAITRVAGSAPGAA